MPLYKHGHICPFLFSPSTQNVHQCTVVKPTSPNTSTSPSEQGTSNQEPSASEYATLRERPLLAVPVRQPEPLQPAKYSLPEYSSTELTVSQNSHSSQEAVPEFPVSECCKLANNRGYICVICTLGWFSGGYTAAIMLILLCSHDHHYAGRFRLRGNLHKAILCTHHGTCVSVCVLGGGGEEAEGLLRLTLQHCVHIPTHVGATLHPVQHVEG